MAHDPYSTLGVSPDADARAIKHAFRGLARRFHPDLNPDNPDAERQFKQVAAAYEVLGHPVRRRQYDAYRARAASTRGGSTGPGSSTNPAASAFVQAFIEGLDRARVVFFDALLPRYLEAYMMGQGYELVYRLVNDLEQHEFMDIMNRPKPSFSARTRIGHIQRECPTFVESGACVDPLGRIVLGQLTRVQLRGLDYRRVTLYAGSFYAQGRTDTDDLAAGILPVLIREYARYLEHNLSEAFRPLATRAVDPNAPLPLTLKQARARDIRHVTLQVLWRLGLATVVLGAIWLSIQWIQQ